MVTIRSRTNATTAEIPPNLAANNLLFLASGHPWHLSALQAKILTPHLRHSAPKATTCTYTKLPKPQLTTLSLPQAEDTQATADTTTGLPSGTTTGSCSQIHHRPLSISSRPLSVFLGRRYSSHSWHQNSPMHSTPKAIPTILSLPLADDTQGTAISTANSTTGTSY